MKKTILAISIFLLGLAAPLPAEVITYQGRLKEAGLPANGNREFIFAVCDAETGGSCLSSSSGAQYFAVQNGLFKSTFTLPAVALAGGEWHLQVTVGGVSLSPRERLTAVPYAVYAATAAYSPQAVQTAGDTMSGQLTLAGSTLTVTGSEFSVGGSTFVVQNGYVGIGTANPTNPLQVSAQGQYVFSANSASTFATLNLVPSGGGTARLNNNSAPNSKVALSVAHVDHLVVVGDGNVGISSTSPSYRLVVSSGAGEAGNMVVITTGTSNVIRLTGAGEVFAGSFYGDGSGLTNVAAATGVDASKVAKAGDTMTGQLTLAASTLTVTGGKLLVSGLGTELELKTDASAGHLFTLGGQSLYLGTGGTDRLLLDSFGNVAVNKAAPAYLFDVGGAANFDGQAIVGGTLTVAGAAFSVAGATLAVANGNVGIGTENPGARLHISSGGMIIDGDVAGVMLQVKAPPSGTTTRISLDGADSNSFQAYELKQPSRTWWIAQNLANFSDGRLQIFDATASNYRAVFFANGDIGLGGNDAQGSPVLMVKPSGLVGIGANSPGSALDVRTPGGTEMAQIWLNSAGTVVSSVSAAGVMQALQFVGDGSGLTNVAAATGVDASKVSKAGDTMTGQLTLAASTLTVTGGKLLVSGLGTDMELMSDVGGGHVNTLSGQALYLGTGGTNRLMIDNLGKVAINKTPPAYLFDVGGEANFDGQAIVGGTLTVAGNAFSVGGSTLVVAGGRVGIGAAAPQAGLDVLASPAQNVALFRSAGATSVALQSDDTSVQKVSLGFNSWSASQSALRHMADINSEANGDLTVFTTNAGNTVGYERLRVMAGGNVGIGTSAPGQLFAVEKDLASVSIDPIAGFFNPSLTDGYFLTVKLGKADSDNNAGLIGYKQDPAGSILGLGVQGDNVLDGGAGLVVKKLGVVGIGTNSPQGRLDVWSTGAGSGDMVQIWRDSAGTVVSSVSAVGYLQAARFIGDGSGLTNVAAATGVDASKVSKAGDTMSGQLTLEGSSLTMKTGGVINFAVDASGHVGVNSYPDASSGLIVTGSNLYEAGVRLSNSGTIWNIGNDVGTLKFVKVDGATSVPLLLTAAGAMSLTGSLYVAGDLAPAFRVGGSTLVVNNGMVGINNATPLEALDVGSGNIRLATSQTLQWGSAANSISASGTGMTFYENSVGRIHVGSTGGAATVALGDYAAVTIDTTSAVHAVAEGAPGSDGRVAVFGDLRSNGSTAGQYLAAGNFEANIDGPDGADLAVGVRALIRRESPGAGVVTKAYGVLVDDIQNQSGVITDTYGLYIGDQTLGTQTNTPYAVYSADPAAHTYFAGKVGIGTLVPTTALDVSGMNTTVAINSTNTTSANALEFRYSGVSMAHLKKLSETGDLQLNSGNSSLTMVAGGSIRMAIESGGNVAIGNITPGYKLDVAGSVNASSSLCIGGNCKSDWNSAGVWSKTGVVVSPATPTDNVLVPSTLTVAGSAFSVGGSTLVVAAGRVGVGVLNPTVALDVSGGVSATTLFAANSVSAGSVLKVNGGGVVALEAVTGNSNISATAAGAKNMVFTTDSVERMRIDNTGKVGVGTTNPRYALEISSAPGSTDQILVVSTGTDMVFGVKGNGEVYGAKFMGDGSGLTNVSGSDASKLPLGGGTMTGALVINASSLTVNATLGQNFMRLNSDGTYGAIEFTKVGVQAGHVGFGNSGGILVPAINEAMVLTGNAGLHLGVAGAPMLTITTGNRVGIGNLIAPAYALDVSTANGTDSYLARLGANGIVISTGGAIQTTGVGNGTVAGNARGNGAVDLQTHRLAATDVASGAYSVVGGGQGNKATVVYAVASGGSANIASGGYSVIGGGSANQSTNGWTTVGGGAGNVASQNNATVSGGSSNIASSYSATVAGGTSNKALASVSAVGGGEYNVVSGSDSVIAGGAYNTVTGTAAVVAGGELNRAGNFYAFVGGGRNNTAYDGYTVVSGGNNNYAGAWASFIGGGSGNNTGNSYAAIVGGLGNATGPSADYAFLGGGYQNDVNGVHAAVGGGWFNVANAMETFIGGGGYNTADGQYGVISGGKENKLRTEAYAGFIGGGERNISTAPYSTVGGGLLNTSSGTYSAVLGGHNNQVYGSAASIAGGENNYAGGYASFVGAGLNNQAPGNYSAIGGGNNNSTDWGEYAFLGGGQDNIVSSNTAAMAGGYQNRLRGQGSFIGGGWNNENHGLLSVLAGGSANTIHPASRYSGLFAGQDNVIFTGDNAVIAGGYTNSSRANYTTISGGLFNLASGYAASVSGGANASAVGMYAMVAGGNNNTAKGDFSFAAGHKSSSTASGTFTWNDSLGTQLDNTVANQVMFKAAGGFWVSTGTVYTDPGLFVDGSNRVGIGTSAPGFKLHVVGGAGGAIAGLTNSVSGTDAAVYGWANSGATAVKGVAAGGYAGRFEGNVYVTSNGVNPALPAKLQVNGDLGLGDGTQVGNAPVVIWLTAAAVAQDGDIVVASGGNQFSTSITIGDYRAIGVVVGATAGGSVGKVAVGGVAVVNCTAATAGQHATTSGTAGVAAATNNPTSGTSIGQFLAGCGTPSAGKAYLLLN